MQKRELVLTAVFSSLVVIILVVGIAAACYFYHKRRRKHDDEFDDDSPEGGNCSRIETSSGKKSKLNGFLSLKTPLISTKTLGNLRMKCITTLRPALKSLSSKL
ncbi:hypothetical protein HHI36_022270 [Cryptolaemus montrouzieri]|uniref:Uncharacterized protein n=1 Tax=Cryptolaemus montrouzieri TaxID=559131 RepID=A0ABD2MZB5_9CUCU